MVKNEALPPIKVDCDALRCGAALLRQVQCAGSSSRCREQGRSCNSEGGAERQQQRAAGKGSRGSGEREREAAAKAAKRAAAESVQGQRAAVPVRRKQNKKHRKSVEK